MIRMTEMVLPGHPDKFCDQVADAVVRQAKLVDPFAYCQVEVSTWYDQVWLSGGVVTRRKLPLSFRDIVIKTGREIGYSKGNFIDVEKYNIVSTICEQVADPRPWVGKVNDQCITIGYAGYDQYTHYLPPEHFLAHAFRIAVTNSCRSGLLKNQGPDGKFLLRLREEPAGWKVEQILITLQQTEEIDFLDFCANLEQTLKNSYQQVQVSDKRWVTPWEEIELAINPNGPFINGGSDGDNGQTGRKLVMDYYGPRISLGGGALSGKDPTHIDRAAAYCAREAAVYAVQSGAKECLVTLAYSPNFSTPLEIGYSMDGRGNRKDAIFFHHDQICARYRGVQIDNAMARGGHFFEPRYPWNGLANQRGENIL